MSNHELLSLHPALLWKHFYAITQIPHPSGSLAQIQAYVQGFCKEQSLSCTTDKVGNILIRKPAIKGMENCQTVILQAHLDMVPQKNTGIIHNFETDALQPFIDGEWVKAKDTTLGADNGIGIAAALAVLESNELKHGSIEVLLTSDEETGMHGVFGLQKGFLTGNILINTDSEDEGELYVGCPGGIDGSATFHASVIPPPNDAVAYKISVTGLLGGHSGVDIHLERASANKLLFRILKTAVSRYNAHLSEVNGGSLRNAIPREAFATVVVPFQQEESFLQLVANIQTIFREEYAGIESSIQVQCEAIAHPPFILCPEIQDDIINAITICPNGVFRHLPQMPETVESSINLAIIKTEGNTISVHTLIRSSTESTKQELCSMFQSTFSLAGAKVSFNEGYPGWQPNLESPILSVMKKVYAAKWGNVPAVKVIHAGLECGIIGALEPQLDLISFGPTIRHPHSPDEKVHIHSVAKFWDFLVATLANIPIKKDLS